MSEFGYEHFEAHDLMKHAISNALTRWDMHTCSMCGYQCGFRFEKDTDPASLVVYYDPGCRCCLLGRWEKRSWSDVYRHITLQIHEKVVEKYCKFWGLTKKQLN
jgi:hypothetical protein